MSRNGITVYLPRDIEVLVERLAREQHRSASSVITDAVRRTLKKKAETPEEREAEFQARMDARMGKAIRDTMLVKESLLLFVRVWLEHNPPLEEHIEDAAAASAAARFERFLDYVARAVDSGRSMDRAAKSSEATPELEPTP